MDNLFDLVILIGPNDIKQSSQQIEYTKKNIIGYRNIYIIPSDSTFNIDGCITISEDLFPFSINTVAEYHGKRNRNAWYFQQLIKLYAGLIIPDILERYLVIDSDTYFLKPTTFIKNEKCLYNFSYENHIPYYEHIKKIASLEKIKNVSGISHHMIFETKYIKELFNLVSNYHNNLNFYKVFLENVNPNDYDKSGASEYEIYFNYMLKYNSDKIELRELKWKNGVIENLNETNYDYISCHYYGIINTNFDMNHYTKMLRLFR
jgi:hypothetical protein